jgi:hypothetical protein
MAKAALRHVVLCVTASGLLMGCVEGSGSSSGSGTQATVAPAVTRAGSGREVEAPDVFQVTDSALWDGRPSLGGIWVASPNVTDPERVVMFNPANGKTVNGALFRRERENPGPSLQVSSDAAEALGMLAGQPTELRVTALRKPAEAAPAVVPTVAVAAAADGASEAPAASEAAGAPVAEASAAETAALATAALAATGASPEAAAAAADGTVEAVAPEAPKRKTWKERRAEAKAKREAEKSAKAAAAAGVAPAEATAATAEGAASETAATADAAAVATVETAPLDARAPEVAAGAAAAAGSGAEPVPEPKKKTRREIREEEKAAETAASEAAAAAEAAGAGAAAPAVESGAGRQIQVASFSKEDNAKRAVEALAKIGVTAEPQKSEKDGKAVWGVVAIGDDALLASIKKAGFADAFYLN